MIDITNISQLILELDQLKLVLRTTITGSERRESTAEHSWSATMIALILISELRQEFGEIDELKVIKLILIHDVVEIYAGDVMGFDLEARKDKHRIEEESLQKLVQIYPKFGKDLEKLWYEFEERNTIEAKIAKAADAICPMFQRLAAKQSYVPFNITIDQLDKTKKPAFEFSKVFTELYVKLKSDLLVEGLISAH